MAHHLVSQHHRRAQDRASGRAVLPIVQVTSADSPERDIDDHLVVTGRTHWPRLQAEAAGSLDDEGFCPSQPLGDSVDASSSTSRPISWGASNSNAAT